MGSLWGGHQEYEAVGTVGDFAFACGNGLDRAGANLLDCDNQLRQLRRIGDGNVVRGKQQFKFGRQRRDALNGTNVVVEIRFRTGEPDWRVVERVSCEQQSILAVQQANRIWRMA